MKINYYGIKEEAIDNRFSKPEDIVDLVLENENNIIFNNTYPTIDENYSDKGYQPKETIIDDNLCLTIEEIHEYGTIYSIYNNTNSKNKTSSKLIIGNNVISLLIDEVEDKYLQDENIVFNLKNNLEKEKVIISSLGKKLKINKLYGTRSNNNFLKTIENLQIEKERQVVENAVLNSIYTINEYKMDNLCRIRKQG